MNWIDELGLMIWILLAMVFMIMLIPKLLIEITDNQEKNKTKNKPKNDEFEYVDWTYEFEDNSDKPKNDFVK